MRNVLAAAIVVHLGAFAASAHDHARCPMAKDHRAAVDHRHDQATGVGHENAEHHFLITPEGGSIRLEVTDAGRVEDRDRIRRHLQLVARSFAAGDFALPMQIHAQVPPGAEAMKRMREAIGYSFSPTDRGGEVRISTKDPAALAAVHSFLRFQIADHGTGDPVE